MTQRVSPIIYFYIPQRYWFSSLPASADENWQGFGIGIYAWTLQTYLRLQADGFPCELVRELPEEGIVIVHRNCLRVHNNRLKPGRKLLLICLKAELKPYPYAQIQVIQNPLDTNTITNKYYIPHWPQPGLIPRNPARGDRFETIAFFGHKNNLAPEFYHPSWQQQLQSLNLSWQPIINCNRWDSDRGIANNWHDYSNVDAIVAVRSFNFHTLKLKRHYHTKPATKLYNAWLAGVPAILGTEVAYQTEHQSELDYIEVTSPQDVIAALKRLRDDIELRRAIIKNGQIRAREIHPSKTTARWRSFLTDVAIPAYYDWCAKSPVYQHLILERNAIIYNLSRLRDKVRMSVMSKDYKK